MSSSSRSSKATIHRRCFCYSQFCDDSMLGVHRILVVMLFGHLSGGKLIPCTSPPQATFDIKFPIWLVYSPFGNATSSRRSPPVNLPRCFRNFPTQSDQTRRISRARQRPRYHINETLPQDFLQLDHQAPDEISIGIHTLSTPQTILCSEICAHIRSCLLLVLRGVVRICGINAKCHKVLLNTCNYI